ncbi:cytochrome c biogenesis protein CcdA, partial [Methanocella conradii]|uniref:cytochrome c biogenesis protein CcdA n=1 Tax=Methanocella conradii TaxID=1175444 RepID=UPI00157C0A1D
MRAMVRPAYLVSILCLFIVAEVTPANAQNVSVQYFHMPGCDDCAKADTIVEELEQNYGTNDAVTFRLIDVSTRDGLDQWQKFGFAEVPAIVINNETRISKENITVKNLNASINAYLNDSVGLADSSLDAWGVPLAFSMGVFSGFSPCLMAILGFILSYTAGTSRGMRDGMSRAVVFGIGLVAAYILLGVCILVYGKSLFGVGAVSVIAGVVSILIGLNMLNILKMPITLDDYVKKSAKNYVGSWMGLFFLGVLFSMVKVPCAAPFLLVLISETITMATVDGVLMLFAFAVGVLAPFMVIGLI